MPNVGVIIYAIVSITVTAIAGYFFLKIFNKPVVNAESTRPGWGSKMGLVLAMAGNAVGLGNFLRFPVQAINNGGGAFIVPYLVCFVLIGIPLLFVEWSMGRFAGTPYAGRPEGDHNIPFILQRMSTQRWIKYAGAIGLFINIAVAGYYCYIESWTLAYVYHSVVGTFGGLSQDQVGQFFDNYTNLDTSTTGIPYESIIFFIFCLGINVYFLSKGLKGGIEKVAKIGMPLLILFGIILAIESLSLTPGSKGAINSGLEGLAFLWTPDLSSIWTPSVWIAAAGQIFFTLAVGMATIQCYASYMKPNEDAALGAMTAGWMNEFVEIVVGSAIIIPLTVGYLGIDRMQDIVKSMGGYGLGFKTLPYLFQQWGTWIGSISGVLWFGLLFIAGITSSLAMGTPVIGFLKDEFALPFKYGAMIFGFLVLLMGLPAIIYYNEGVFTEIDDWAGTYALVIFGFIELVIFAWIFGMTKGWEEITRGAEIKVPGFFKFIIKFVTPLFLGIILVSNIPNMVKRVWYPSSGYATFAQVYLLSLLLFILAGIFIASRQRKKANIQ
ncbi:MAG: sodium:calcium symporter [Saprospiraceae bacterium]|nr:sodium:calcium symporter [Saprospiraceae bacterium]